MKWEVTHVRAHEDIPEDWEPFAVTETHELAPRLWLRRRVVPVETKPVPHGVLSAKEMAALRDRPRE